MTFLDGPPRPDPVRNPLGRQCLLSLLALPVLVPFVALHALLGMTRPPMRGRPERPSRNPSGGDRRGGGNAGRGPGRAGGSSKGPHDLDRVRGRSVPPPSGGGGGGYSESSGCALFLVAAVALPALIVAVVR